MRYTPNLELAIRVAAREHSAQTRKFSGLPYITHLVSVAFLLSEYTDDETAIIASLLHDTLEDTDYSEFNLRKDFGDEVFSIVKTLTEPDRKSHNLSWLETKLTYVKQLESGDKRAVMIAAADKIHNFISITTDFKNNSYQFIKYFGNKHNDRRQAYQAIANVINFRLDSDHKELLNRFNQAFDVYMKFIDYVQENS